jgi:hypothetical protein
MKRNPDLIRSLLLLIEANDVKGLKGREIEVDGHEYAEVMSHLNLLADAGFIIGEYSRSSTNPDRVIATEHVFDLTWAGHEYLDTVRDNKIWRETKAIAHKVGATSFEFLFEIAKGLARAELTRQTGIAV